MPSIISDDPNVKKLLTELCEMILECGSYIHHDLEIRDQEGMTSLFLKNHENPPPGPYIKIAHEAAIPYEKFDFDIDGQTLVLAHNERNADPAHLKMMLKMVEFYNVSGKFKWHLDNCVWLHYEKAKAALDHILNSRAKKDVAMFKTMLRDPELKDELAIWTFFKSRLFHCAKFNKNSTKVPCLFPILELFNHSVFAPNFQTQYPDNEPSSTGSGGPKGVGENGECFASYARFDALDMFIHYNYPDPNVPLLRSVNMKMTLEHESMPQTKIHIKSASGLVLPKDLPEALKPLAFFASHMTLDEANKIAKLDHIIIPHQKAPRALRRILAYVLNKLHPNINQNLLRALILHVEEMILQGNRDYFLDLQSINQKETTGPIFKKMIDDLAQQEISKIDNYRAFWDTVQNQVHNKH